MSQDNVIQFPVPEPAARFQPKIPVSMPDPDSVLIVIAHDDRYAWTPVPRALLEDEHAAAVTIKMFLNKLDGMISDLGTI
jgi:hypothetical protein